MKGEITAADVAEWVNINLVELDYGHEYVGIRTPNLGELMLLGVFVRAAIDKELGRELIILKEFVETLNSSINSTALKAVVR